MPKKAKEKLILEKALKAVGEDDLIKKPTGARIMFKDGYNKAKAEIRQQIEKKFGEK